MNRGCILGCAIPSVVLAGGVWFGMRALRGAEPPAAHFEIVDKGVVEQKVTETGSVEPLKKVEVKSKVAGRLSRLLVDEGSIVRPGQLLATIDPTEINSQVAQIKAQLDGARARHQQAERAADYQTDQTRSTIRQAEEGLRTAQARLRVALEQSGMQPRLTGSAVDQAEANLKAARDNLTLLQSATHPQAVVVAQSGFEDAKAGEDNARRHLDRQQKLLAKGFVSEQVVDTARTELASATARRQQAEKKLELIDQQNRLELAAAESQINQQKAALETARANTAQAPIARQEVEVARSAVAQAEAALRVARAGSKQDLIRQNDVGQARAGVVQLENQLRENQVHQQDTTLVAPMSGVVTKRYVEQGELVTSGVSTFSSGTPVLQIADLSQMLVKMTISEVDVHKVRVGQPVEITLDAARGGLVQGHVSRVAPSAATAAAAGQDSQSQQAGNQNSVVRFAVQITVDHPDARLKPGMSARCDIIIARHRNVLRLPSDGIEGAGAEARAQLVSQPAKGGKPAVITPRTVRIGLRGDNFVEVLSGLQAGDRVKPAPYTGPKRQGVEINMD